MTVVLRVLSGARAGHVLTTNAAVIHIGRAAGAELRFDPEHDTIVSGRHAIIEKAGGRCVLRDEGSRNGTYLNGTRVVAAVELHDGDRIAFGAGGPEVEVGLTESTTERVRLEVGRHVRAWQRAAVALVIVLFIVTGSLVAQARRERQSWERQRAEMLARIDSAVAAGEQTIISLQGEMQELAVALRESQQQVISAGAALEGAQRRGEQARLPVLRSELEGALSNLTRQQAVAGIDHGAIRDRNARAVAKVFVEDADGVTATGTAFAVRADATLITSRHVIAPGSGTPRRVAVQFSYSDQVWPARVLVIDENADLAVIKVDAILGSVPTVAPLNLRADTLPRGAPAVIIGYPLGGETEASSRAGRTVIRPVVGGGVITTLSGTALELEAYGATGSSGSPVFDGNGEVVGIAFGGRREAAVHYLVAVPARAAARLLDRISRP